MKYNGKNLKKVLEAHKRWLLKDAGWSKDDKADFRDANLNGADLRGAILNRADLSGASLFMADLRRAHLKTANLKGTDLCGADLSKADLREANLSGADLRQADLTFADMKEADLTLANLDLANLTEAKLECANLTGTKNLMFPMACPDSGAFIAWKSCVCAEAGQVIVKLLIPEDAKRSSATGRKCRADKAIVQEIQTIEGEPLDKEMSVWSLYDESFEYVVGKTVTPREPFCECRFDECASGIHFFITRQEAVDY